MENLLKIDFITEFNNFASRKLKKVTHAFTKNNAVAQILKLRISWESQHRNQAK